MGVVGQGISRHDNRLNSGVTFILYCGYVILNNNQLQPQHELSAVYAAGSLRDPPVLRRVLQPLTLALQLQRLCLLLL